jgi:ElaB/YqjD/DUF883 family membrane-anchored ribosome-binding protein
MAAVRKPSTLTPKGIPMIATTKPFGQETSADSAVKTGQHLGNEALDTLADKAQELKDEAKPVLNRVAAKAEELARRSADAMRDRSADIRDRAVRMSDSTVGYIKDEPLKAILIAAATGAALMALVSLLSRRSRH